MTGRGLHGRRVARLTLIATLLLFGFGVFLIVFAPNTMGPSDDRRSLLAGFGLAGILVGLGWMVRIIRADPEAHPTSWRSRKG